MERDWGPDPDVSAIPSLSMETVGAGWPPVEVQSRTTISPTSGLPSDPVRDRDVGLSGIQFLAVNFVCFVSASYEFKCSIF